jgi:photosystem II stability/assembly factor-like uncharacterized protein
MGGWISAGSRAVASLMRQGVTPALLGLSLAACTGAEPTEDTGTSSTDTSESDTSATDTGDTGSEEATGWVPQTSGTDFDLHAVHFVDAETGWAVGQKPGAGAFDEGVVLKTIDGGESWLEQDVGMQTGLYDVTFLDASTGWVVGGSYEGPGNGYRGYIFATTDGGETWQMFGDPMGSIDILRSVHAVEAETVWCAGDRGTILTIFAQVPGFEVSGFELRDVAFSNPDTGWVLARSTTSPVRNIIYRSVNAGTNWARYDWSFFGVGASQYLEAIDFVDSTGGWAVGRAGVILGIDAEVPLFEPIDSGTLVDLHDVSAVSDDASWAVGAAGTILTFTGEPETPWVAQESGSSEDLLGVHFIDDQTGWAVGTGGTILKTTDGGGR